MKRTQLSIIALLASPAAALAVSSCTAPSAGSDPPPDEVSETQQAQTCSSTCSNWGGQPVACTSPDNTCGADTNGVTCDGTTIACSCANLSVTVTTNPVGNASN